MADTTPQPDVVDLLSATILDSIKVARSGLDALERVASDRETMAMALTVATGLATELLSEVRGFVGVLARAAGEHQSTEPRDQAAGDGQEPDGDSSAVVAPTLIDLTSRIESRRTGS
jgi:hypothetical protein